jgi:cytochrome c oxidase accessory protein FixG
MESNALSKAKLEVGASTILMAEEQVLPTLRRDGSRNWLSPSMAKGFFWHRRRWLAYGLIAFFVTLPHLRIAGKPYVLLDIARREFTFLGHTFYPTDTPLLACLMLMAFFTIMLVTALAGRVWCGWGCPQTVYLEFLFRPIDRFFSGTLGRGGPSRKQLSAAAHVAKFLAYLAACMFLAHTFLSYFVGTDRLWAWMHSSPSEHPIAFLVMGAATAGLLFNFLYFREQFCMIACPYGRFQSVMLDRSSHIVSYDVKRGEPRKRGKRASEPSTTAPEALTLEVLQSEKVGDCIECGRCTAVCPTGIDIRDGLQLECIHCAQCIDACNEIMTRVGKPKGLIRYSSQDAMSGKKSHVLRARTIIYPTIIAIAATLFLVILSTKFAFDARVMRMTGAPFTIFEDRHVQNNFRVRLVNRSQSEQDYMISTSDDEIKARWSGVESLRLVPGQSVLIPVDLQFPMQKTQGLGSTETKLQISDSSGATREISVRLHGPR